MTIEEFLEENTRLRHALQTGIAYEQQLGENASFYFNNEELARIIKHLRVGLDAVMCEQAAIFHALIKKGLITKDEMFWHSLNELKKEVKTVEERLSAHYKVSIKLG